MGPTGEGSASNIVVLFRINVGVRGAYQYQTPKLDNDDF